MRLFSKFVGCTSERRARRRGPLHRLVLIGLAALFLLSCSAEAKKVDDSAQRITKSYFKSLSLQQIDTDMTIEPLKGGSVLLLIFDALNPKHLGVYGNPRETSPQIDQLARGGIVLANYFSNSSWTRPSFTTITTGLPKSGHGVELEGGWRLQPEIKTLSERFRKAGYKTAGFTGNPLVRKSWGFDQGYQVYEDTITLGLKAFPRDGILVGEAIKWLETVGDKPFFLMLFLTSSHPPYSPPLKPRQFLSQVPQGKIISHPFKEYKEPLGEGDHQRIVAAYDDEIAYLDGEVRRLIDFLRSSNRLDKTIVAMTADHGEVFGLHNCYLHAYHMWEPALRVPLIISAPNVPIKGKVDYRPFTHLDVAPTLLDLTGIQYEPDFFSGVSLVDALKDRGKYRRRAIYSQYNAHGVRRQAIRIDEWKLIHHHKVDKRALKKLDELHPGVKQPNPLDLPTLAWEKERYELYNLLQDPNEAHNVFKQNSGGDVLEHLVEELQKRLHAEKVPGRLTEEMIKALQAAGYLRTKSDGGPPKTSSQ